MNDETSAPMSESTPMTVLVCERSRVQRHILCTAVEQLGLSVAGVATGEEALNRMQSDPSDLFLTGIEVGEIGGIDLCWHLKASSNTAHVYTIVITASDEPQLVAGTLDAGADDFVRKPLDKLELQARLRAAARIVRMQRGLKLLAETDPLTGAANRRCFMHALEVEVDQAARSREPLSVAMVDLDHFKNVNDTYGHSVGDDVLIHAVQAMRGGLRQQDIVGRLGGEEFCVILPQTATTEAAELAEAVRLAIAAMEVETGQGGLRVSASIGVATFSSAEDSVRSLLQAVDEALYAAKSGGRNRVQLAAACS